MNIHELNLSGVRNMGDIFIAWDDNHVLDLISNQKSTSLHEKAEQFRLLKEEFRDTGRYLDEDVAYVYFKRYELMSEYDLAKEKGIMALILFMPNFFILFPGRIGAGKKNKKVWLPNFLFERVDNQTF